MKKTESAGEHTYPVHTRQMSISSENHSIYAELLLPERIPGKLLSLHKKARRCEAGLREPLNKSGYGV